MQKFASHRIITLNLSSVLVCIACVWAEPDIENARANWLCSFVQLVSATKYGKNVVGFVEGHYNFTGPISIREIDFPSGCDVTLSLRGNPLLIVLSITPPAEVAA